MATVKLRYVNRFRDRHGRVRCYFRRGAVCEPLPEPVGSPAFNEAYGDLLAEYGSGQPARQRKAAEGTLAWVIEKYRSDDNPSWRKLRPSTQEWMHRLFDWLVENYGRGDFATLQEHHLRAIRNRLADRPSVADRTVDKVGMLWRFAKEHLNMRLGPNPAREVASIHRTHEPNKAWPPELCEAFEREAPPNLVRAYFIMRYTGQRRSDVVRMHRRQFDGTAIEVVQQKTGTYVWVPCHKRLRQHFLETGISGEFLVTTQYGGPFRATSLTNRFCGICSELGFPGYSPHGLRHLAGAALAEAGCSVHEVMSILGHVTESEAYEYVRQAQRKVMARSAIDKWEARG